jgi:OmpA-OmpF porin, OOP family
MNNKFLKIVLLLCISSTLVNAQNKTGKKRGMLSFSANYSDYGFIKTVKDSSISAAFNRKGLFKSGNSSFGIGLSYWKGLGSHVDFSGNFVGTFSNFPALFVKDDSIGQAGFTPQLDALLHFRAFKDNRLINPFLTGGIGAGYFGKQLAVYAPVGTGIQIHFNAGAYIFIQAQWRMALTDGINEDYMFYSVGFAYQAKAKKEKKPEPKIEIPVIDTVKKESAKDTVGIPRVDTDKDDDGVPDIRDNCPDVKGTVTGCPDFDGDGIADKDDQCKDVKGVARYKGCPVPDSDADGVNDDDDDCITIPGLKDNNGCPPAQTDKDGDGVADKDDKCPDIAGTAQNSGCPMQVVEGGKLLKVTSDSMRYYIRFDFDKANITTEAFSLLKQIVQILKADKTLLIKIDGHADNFGLEKYNIQISQDRANIARDYFLSYNIARNRIQTAWFGSAIPYDIHQGWLDRRVEITIYKKK